MEDDLCPWVNDEGKVHIRIPNVCILRSGGIECSWVQRDQLEVLPKAGPMQSAHMLYHPLHDMVTLEWGEAVSDVVELGQEQPRLKSIFFLCLGIRKNLAKVLTLIYGSRHSTR